MSLTKVHAQNLFLTTWDNPNYAGGVVEDQVELPNGAIWVVDNQNTPIGPETTMPRLAKLSASGNTLLTKTYSVIGASDMNVSRVFLNSAQSELVVFGTLNGFGAGSLDMFVARADTATGDFIDFKTLGTVGYDMLNGITQTSDGGFICGGSSSPSGSPVGVVVKLSSTLNIAWSRQYNITGGSGYFYLVEEIVPNEYYGRGQFTDGSVNYEVHVLLNSTGSVVQAKEFIHPTAGSITGATMRKVGSNYVFTGAYYTTASGTQYALMATFNSDLSTVISATAFTTPSYSGFVGRSYFNNNGELMLSGFYSNGSTQDILLTRMDAVTSIVYESAVVSVGGDWNFSQIKKTPDGAFLIGGSREVLPSSEEGVLIRVDNHLSAGCNSTPIALSPIPVTFTTSSVTLVASPISFVTPTATPSSNPENSNFSPLCSVPACNLSLSQTIQNVTCNGANNGSIDITLSGSNGLVTYSWSHGPTTQDVSSLSPGSYTVDIEDGNGCTLSESFTITEPNVLQVSLSGFADPLCNGGTNGNINVSVSGGTPTYSYLWSGPNTFSSSNEDISGLEAGSYFLTVTDANSCTASLNHTLTQPPLLAAALVSQSNVTCNGADDGAATIVASGGVPPYAYSWSPSGGSAAAASNLPPGTYTATVTDANNCTSSVNVTITEPQALNISASVTNVACNGQSTGAINVTVSGGTTPYSYSWNSGQTTQDISNVVAGSYILTVTDNNNCTESATYSVSEPPALQANTTVQNVSCNGACDGQATAIASGGTAPYNYVWNTTPAQSSATATGLCPGTYTVNISDALNCQLTPSVTITQPAVLSVSVAVTAATCGSNNGAVAAIPSGGTVPYSYSWSNASTDSSQSVGLGTYSVTVTDNNSCTASASGTVTVESIPVDICLVTVDTSGSHNIVVWEKPAVGFLEEFNIYRDVLGTYTLIGTVPFDSLSQYIDTALGVNPAVTSYRYRISTVDTCGNESVLSPFHETIHVTANFGVGNDINLIWDDYIGFNFTYYKLGRDLGSGWSLIDSVSSTSNTYTDLNGALMNPVAYRVNVIHPVGCTADRAINHNSTRSNRGTIQAPSTVEENLIDVIMVAPNPTTGMAYISLQNGSLEDDLMITLSDLSGRLVASKTYDHLDASGKIDIDLTSFNSGVYLLQLRSGNQLRTIRLVKQ